MSNLVKSSYGVSTLDYSDIFKVLIGVVGPRKIVEFGILEGYSLQLFALHASSCEIIAYDIFDKFDGNHANSNIVDKFKKFNNVSIIMGDFYDKLKEFPDESIDIMHIDIANTGDVYEYAIDHGLSKITCGGIMILEGGSKERDLVDWMIKYNKKPIYPYIDKLNESILVKQKYINIVRLDKFPSMTIIKKLKHYNFYN